MDIIMISSLRQGRDGASSGDLRCPGFSSLKPVRRVDFNICFPGWYPTRTVESVTSQLYFEDSLNDDILRTQALYNTSGARDTRNTDDKVAAPDQQRDFVLQTQKMPDGALLAWKTFIVRSSTGPPCARPTASTSRRSSSRASIPRTRAPSPPE
ncbi:hypothetical protein [Cystobacter fuscus]|uniref:hypothetical protein n=1 Tax=Cystobacter fuscus TaxID=43 RepID=UPI0037BF4BF4